MNAWLDLLDGSQTDDVLLKYFCFDYTCNRIAWHCRRLSIGDLHAWSPFGSAAKYRENTQRSACIRQLRIKVWNGAASTPDDRFWTGGFLHRLGTSPTSLSLSIQTRSVNNRFLPKHYRPDILVKNIPTQRSGYSRLQIDEKDDQRLLLLSPSPLPRTDSGAGEGGERKGGESFWKKKSWRFASSKLSAHRLLIVHRPAHLEMCFLD